MFDPNNIQILIDEEDSFNDQVDTEDSFIDTEDRITYDDELSIPQESNIYSYYY